MFLRQLSIEIRKTLSHPALWLGLLGLSLLLAIYILVLHSQVAAGYRPPAGGLEQDLLGSLGFFGWFSSLVYGVCAAVIVAFDYPERGIQVWLARGLPRPTLLLARLAAVSLFGLLLALYTTLASLALAAASRQLFFGQVDRSLFNWSALLPAALRTFWSGLPYLALALLLGVTSRSPLFSAAGTVVFATVLETLLSSQAQRFPTLVRYLPVQLSRVLLDHAANLNLAAPPVQAAMPELRAAAAIALLALGLFGAAVWVFARQDLS